MRKLDLDYRCQVYYLEITLYFIAFLLPESWAVLATCFLFAVLVLIWGKQLFPRCRWYFINNEADIYLSDQLLFCVIRSHWLFWSLFCFMFELIKRQQGISDFCKIHVLENIQLILFALIIRDIAVILHNRWVCLT